MRWAVLLSTLSFAACGLHAGHRAWSWRGRAGRTLAQEAAQGSRRPYGWEELAEHARNQSARYAAGEYPGRTAAGNAQYELYKRWCTSQGLSNADYVRRYVQWDSTLHAALEPALSPYLLEDGIEHWILWHDPENVHGSTELDMEREVPLALKLLATAGAALDQSELVVYQNVPPMRSLPTIAHSHVFVHVSRLRRSDRHAIVAMRRGWRKRSPWLRAAASTDERDGST